MIKIIWNNKLGIKKIKIKIINFLKWLFFIPSSLKYLQK